MSTSVGNGAQPGEPPVSVLTPGPEAPGARKPYDGLIGRLSWWSLWILLVAAVLDALTTYISLQSPDPRESNPLGRSLISELGLGGAMVVRVLIGVVYFVFLKWILDTQSHRVGQVRGLHRRGRDGRVVVDRRRQQRRRHQPVASPRGTATGPSTRRARRSGGLESLLQGCLPG